MVLSSIMVKETRAIWRIDNSAIGSSCNRVILDSVQQFSVESEYVSWPPNVTRCSDVERGRMDDIMHGALEAAGSGDLQKAISLLNGARDDGSITGGTALFGKALACERAGDTRNALRYVEKSDQVGRNYGPPYSFRAELLYRLQRRDELHGWCEMWSDMDPETNHMFLTQARLMYMDGDHEGAQDHLESILILEDSMAGAYELAGDLLAHAGDLRGALIRYTESLNTDRTISYVHVKRARLLSKMGRFDLAARACRYGLRVRPYNKDLRRMLRDVVRDHS